MTTQERPDIDVNKKGVELDANGNPYYKWPPFPDPPENVKIMPFSEFKASGIQISFDDEAEVDGLGIPTVRLPIIHNNEAPPRKKKKTKMTPAGEEIRQRNVWWEEVSNHGMFNLRIIKLPSGKKEKSRGRLA